MTKLLRLFVLIACLAAAGPAHAQGPDSGRKVLAFYYNWFDQSTWTPAVCSDLPVQPYTSADRAAMARHVDEAKSAGIDALIVSWYGPKVEGNQTETNFAVMLEVAQERGFTVALDFETASPFLNGRAEIVAALQHALSVHAAKPAYLRHGGKPVLFFWAIQQVPRAAGQSAFDAWRSIRDEVDPGRTAVWLAEGVDIRYQSVFDGHHLYSVAWSNNVKGTLADWGGRVRKWSAANGNAPRLWVATVMPGYNDLKTGRSNAFVRDRADGAFYESCWQGAIDSGADWVIITSFNEWVEGSQIEPSQTYGNRYLELTRAWSDRFRTGVAQPAPAAQSPADVPVAGVTATIQPPPTLPTDRPVPEGPTITATGAISIQSAALAVTATVAPSATATEPATPAATATVAPPATATEKARPRSAESTRRVPPAVAQAAPTVIGATVPRPAAPTEPVSPIATVLPPATVTPDLWAEPPVFESAAPALDDEPALAPESTVSPAAGSSLSLADALKPDSPIRGRVLLSAGMVAAGVLLLIAAAVFGAMYWSRRR